ncbi:metal-sensitive transcriptional regulator [Candidatus Peregrinibacteria bacterium]|nr:MAG: metal-sensitive transcriptional regulator [Candidatus Peregrinibacteria bacterium]
MKKEFKDKTLLQLKKAQGMLKKVISMAEEDAYCIDVLQQSLATVGLVKGANKLILENHLNACFKEGMKTANDLKQQELIRELLHVINKA